MDGLDAEEIQLANLENAFTLGAEYYGKVYVRTAETIKKLNHVTLQGMSKLITDGDHGSPDYQESGILYLLSESVQEGYIDTSKCRFITPEKNAELRRKGHGKGGRIRGCAVPYLPKAGDGQHRLAARL